MTRVYLSLLLLVSLCANRVEAQTVFAENFESVTVPALPTGYTNVVIGTGRGWHVRSSALVQSYATIPAHTKYAALDGGNSANNVPAILTTPKFSGSASRSAYLSLAYCFNKLVVRATRRSEKAWIEQRNAAGAWVLKDSLAITDGWEMAYIKLNAVDTIQLRFLYSDSYSATDTIPMMGMGIDDIKVFYPYSGDISLVEVSPVAGSASTGYKAVGSTVEISGRIQNISPDTIRSFNASYKVGASAPVTSAITGFVLPPMAFYNFSIPTLYTLPDTGLKSLLVYVTVPADTAHRNDTLRTSVIGVATMPTKKLFFEEGTGGWCMWCVRGIVYMDSLWNAHANKVSVSVVHNRDGMSGENAQTLSYTNYLTALGARGFPMAVVDRHVDIDPGQVFDAYEAMNNDFGFADIRVENTKTATTLTTKASVKFAVNASGDYRLALIVTEDRVHGTTAAFNQANAYAGGASGPMANREYNFVTLPSTVPAAQMFYDKVARFTIPDMAVSPTGVASSLPATLVAGTEYPYTFAPVTIPATWAMNKLIATVILIDNNPSSPNYKRVLNSNHQSITLGVSDVIAGVTGFCIFPNPAQDNATLVFDVEQPTIAAITVYDILGRVVYQSTMSAAIGKQVIPLDTHMYAPGTYQVVVATTTGAVTQQMVIAQ